MQSPLPKYFPTDSLDRLDYNKILRFYEQFVTRHYQEYGFGHFILAAYASIPALLTPELLYKTWLNFNQFVWKGKTVSIHRIAIADIFLSPLCREVGYELYEMHPNIKNAFIEWLKKSVNSSEWEGRSLHPPRTIAAFLIEYHQRQNEGTIRWGTAYEEVQNWSNWLYINPAKAQNLLWKKLASSKEQQKEATTMQVMDFWAKAQQRVEILYQEGQEREQLDNFKGNAIFANALKSLMQENNSAFLKNIQEYPELKQFLNDEPEAGFLVKIPKSVQTEMEEISPSTLFAGVIGLNEYQYIPQPLKGCVPDAQAMVKFLQQRDNIKGLFFYDKEANYAQANEIIEHFQQARNGDICLFYFAGHAKFKDNAAKNGRELQFYDTPMHQETSTPSDEQYDQKSYSKSSVSFNPDPSPKTLSQFDLETQLYPLVKDKEVHIVLIFDTHTAELESRTNLANSPLRKNAEDLKGSVVILNGGQMGEDVTELFFKKDKQHRGAFTYFLEETLLEGGQQNSYQQLLQLILYKMSQRGVKHTPLLESFPKFAKHNQFLTNKWSSDNLFHVHFDKSLETWRLEAGAQQGITPSLYFMKTELHLNNGTLIAVDKVFPEYSTLHFSEKDVSKTFQAKLIQTAFPKIKMAFAEEMNREWRQELEASIEQHNIYYIDLVEDTTQARYLINYGEEGYYLEEPAQLKNSIDRPVFKYERDPFELIKQMEYIAHWTGVLQFQNPNTGISDKWYNIEIEQIEGDPLDAKEIDFIKPRETVEVKGTQSLVLNYQQVDNQWLPPAIRCKITTRTNQKLYYQVLWLNERYGVRYLGTYQGREQVPTRAIGFEDEYDEVYVNFEAFGNQKTFILHQQEIFDFFDIDTLQLYLKIFISDKPLFINPLEQNALELENQNLRSSSAKEGFLGKTFSIVEGINWTTLTVPIRVEKEKKVYKK